MAPRSLASSTFKSDTQVKSAQKEDMYFRRPEYDHSGSTCTQKVRFSRAHEEDDSSGSKPRVEGFCRGSWWEVDIVQHRDKYFLAKYLSPHTGEEDAWLPLNHLRLKNRKSDDWDCNILKRGMDVSVNCTHPDYKELKLHTKALYDAKIIYIARAAHKFECTCKFHIKFYCVKTEDPIGLTERPLLAQTRVVNISSVSILQQPGIVPFYEILKSHLSKKWIQVSRWSNDAFFLRETKLNLHVPPDYGENRLCDDDDDDDGLEEALLATGATRLSEAFTYSFKVQKSQEQDNLKKPAANATSNLDFKEPSGSEKKNDAEHFTTAGDNPGGKDNSPSEHDIFSARVVPESRGAEAAPFGRVSTQPVRSGAKRPRDDVPVLSRRKQEASPKKKQELSPKLINKKSASQQKDERVYESRSLENREDKVKNSEDEVDSEDEIVDIGGGSSDEGEVNIQPPLKTDVGKNLQTSGRRCDDAVHRRLRPRLNREAGPSKRKPDSGSGHTSQGGSLRVRSSARLNREGGPSELNPEVGLKGTNRKESPGKRQASRGENGDSEILEMDPSIPGSVTEPTKALKGKHKKIETNSRAQKLWIDQSSRPEGRETNGEPSKPLTRLRARNPGKKQAPGTGGNNSSNPRHTPPKSSPGQGSGGVHRISERPLYLDLFDQVSENEKQDDTMKCEMQSKKPKSGVNADWDPTSFKYPVPTLEEKRAELKLHKHQKQQQQQQGQPQKQQMQPVTDCRNDVEEQAEDKAMAIDQEGEVSTCQEHKVYLKEDVGMICSVCAVVVIGIESLVPSLGIRQPRQPGEASDWDAGRSPDHLQETTEYQKLEAEKEVTWMNSCNLPLRIQNSMHPHQKDGFEFLWRNLAHGDGDNRTRREDRNTGCILSHAPGTGKTFLVIAFLQSYMDQFPKCRPMIVAPKIMLRAWEAEFQRWKSDISVYILNSARESGKRLIQIHEDAGVIESKSKSIHLSPRRLLDTFRLAMLYEWGRNRSVILVSYNLFSSLCDESRDNALSPEGEIVRTTLLDGPSLVVLDEGHFPRNKGTRIRKSLMTVKTNVRILLSGTLFQNNFEELFNTLYLVRPGFVEGFASFVPRISDEDNQSQLKKFQQMERVSKEAESRARKLFVEEVGMKIEQGQSSKAQSADLDYGLERLAALTTDFVHHHTGGVLSVLPGLRDFAVLLKPTQQQCSILEYLQKNFHKPAQYLEREIAVSQTSIHPKLIRGLEFAKSVDINAIFRHYREQKLGSGRPGAASGGGSIKGHASGFSKEAMDPSEGVKTKFVFDLLCFSKPAKEKVLVFSQHITPLDLLADMFIAQFKWRQDFEYLKLDGQLSLDERARIIDKFNNCNSEACVLLASTKACGEGISLIGASRVVFLDVLWNPAVIKQAISRAFRLGQKKIVYVYRLIASDTIEEHKYKKAIRKDWLSRSIFSASHGAGLKTSDTARQERKVFDASDDKGAEDKKPSGVSGHAEPARKREVRDTVNETGGLSSPNQEDDDVHRLRRIQDLLAWEVNVATCKDGMLEKILENDNRERKTFVKVIEHGSDFREKNIPFGPDAREWFLADMEDSEPLDMKDINEEAYPSDSDEEDLL